MFRKIASVLFIAALVCASLSAATLQTGLVLRQDRKAGFYNPGIDFRTGADWFNFTVGTIVNTRDIEETGVTVNAAVNLLFPADKLVVSVGTGWETAFGIRNGSLTVDGKQDAEFEDLFDHPVLYSHLGAAFDIGRFTIAADYNLGWDHVISIFRDENNNSTETLEKGVLSFSALYSFF